MKDLYRDRVTGYLRPKIRRKIFAKIHRIANRLYNKDCINFKVAKKISEILVYIEYKIICCNLFKINL